MNVFRLFAVVVVFIGAQLQFGLVWDLADVLMGIMAIINLPVIVILGNTALKCLDDYLVQKKEGKIRASRLRVSGWKVRQSSGIKMFKGRHFWNL